MNLEERIKQLDSVEMAAADFQKLLRYIDEDWYVETRPMFDGSVQGGTVQDILRDRYGVPVCLKVISGDGEIDFISVDRVKFYESYSGFSIDSVDEPVFDRTREFVLGMGYEFIEDECLYRHPETGHEICW